jgi:hypothetical protein
VIFVAYCYKNHEPLELAGASGDTFADASQEARLSEQDPISIRPRLVPISGAAGAGPTTGMASGGGNGAAAGSVQSATFNRQELNQILNLYGRKVAAGEWRDYAIDMGREKAVFSVFRRTSECPLYTIEKSPRLARKQGAYCVVAASGLVLKRGHELARVLEVLDRRVRLLPH